MVSASSAPESATAGEIDIRQLLEAGLHFGHQTKRWNPKMKRFIFDKRNGVHIIDLAKSLAHLKAAQQFLYETAAGGKGVLFIGTKKQAQEPVKEAATATGQHYVTFRWLGGTLTNHRTLRRSVGRMREIQKMSTDGTFESLPKKEVSNLRRELEKLERNLTGVAQMAALPGAVIVIDVAREANAVSEANRLGIPVVALVDTNCSPDDIDFPIPGNDDAIRAIKLIVTALQSAIARGVEEYSKVAVEMARKKASEEDASKTEQKAADDKRRTRPKTQQRAARGEGKAEARPKAAAAEAQQESKPEPKAATEPAGDAKPDAAPAQ